MIYAVIIYLLLYVGSIALLCDNWHRSFDVSLGDCIFFALLSVVLTGWLVWPIGYFSDGRRGKPPVIVLRKKE
jgi:hypothetical protein